MIRLGLSPRAHLPPVRGRVFPWLPLAGFPPRFGRPGLLPVGLPRPSWTRTLRHTCIPKQEIDRIFAGAFPFGNVLVGFGRSPGRSKTMHFLMSFVEIKFWARWMTTWFEGGVLSRFLVASAGGAAEACLTAFSRCRCDLKHAPSPRWDDGG